MKLIVVGSLNMDVIIPVNPYPKAGETVTGGVITRNPGGKGANQAVAAARLGADVSMVGAVGKDADGGQMLQALQSEGITTQHVRVCNEATGQAFIHLEAGGQNRIILAPGANASFSKQMVLEAQDVIAAADAILVQLEIPLEAVSVLIETANQHGVPVFLDPAPARQDLFNHVLTADWVTPNEHEAKMLSALDVADEASARQVAEKLLSVGYRNVLLKAGANGAYALSGSECIYQHAFSVEAVDTTAAGDAFNAAFAIEWCLCRNLRRALRFACAAGAFATTKLGAQQSLPTRQNVERILRTRL